MKKRIKFITGLAAFAAVLIVCAVKAQFMPGEVVPQSQVTLDSFFVTNAVPSQLQYWELIDTMFYYVNSMYTNSQAALANSQTAMNAGQTAYGYVGFNVGGFGSFSSGFYPTNNFGCFITNSSSTCSVNFNSPMNDTNYVVIFQAEFFATNVSVTLKTLTNFTFRMAGINEGGGSGGSAAVDFIVDGQ